MIKRLRYLTFIVSLTYSCFAWAMEPADHIIELEKPKAVIMGDVIDDHMRLNVFAKPTSELAYGALQYRLIGEDDWEETKIFPLPRSQYYSDAIDIQDLKPASRYEYRVGTFHIPDQSLLSNITLVWNDQENPNYDYEIFHSYENMIGERDLCFMFGSCQYDGPLLKMLEKSPLALLNVIMKSKVLRKIALFTKITKLPGYRKTIGKTRLGTIIDIFALAEKEGKFFRTDDSRTFRTVIEYCSENGIGLRGFVDMGDTYYRDWLNKYAGAKNTEEVYKLIADAITTSGRYELQKIMPTLVQIDDHALTDNYTKNTLSGEDYTLFMDSCWRMADLVQRQMAIYDPVTKHIGYRWYETQLWGLPVFIGDFRSEMVPGIEKISGAQKTALKGFLSKWGNYPKAIVSQVPIGPDDNSSDGADKWEDEGYQDTRNDILNYLYSNKIKNTFWLGGDIHSGLFADVVHTRKSADRDRVRGFPREIELHETEVSMRNIVLAEAVASPFNWPIQFESMVLDPYKPLGTSDRGSFCIVNQSPLVKRNHAGIFRLLEDGNTVEIVLLGNDPDNPSGVVALRKVYHLEPYQS